MVFSSRSTALKPNLKSNKNLKKKQKLVSRALDYDKYVNDAIDRLCIGNNKEELKQSEPQKTHPGHRLIDFAELENLVTKTLLCSTCKLTDTLSIGENAKIGFVSTISINCSFCLKNEKRIKRNYFRKQKAKANKNVLPIRPRMRRLLRPKKIRRTRTNLNGESSKNSQLPRLHWYEPNVRAMLATYITGVGPQDMQEILSSLDLPNTRSWNKSAYVRLSNRLGKHLRLQSKESMRQAMVEEIKATIRHKSKCTNENDIVNEIRD